jgi:hypothetical protein
MQRHLGWWAQPPSHTGGEEVRKRMERNSMGKEQETPNDEAKYPRRIKFSTTIFEFQSAEPETRLKYTFSFQMPLQANTGSAGLFYITAKLFTSLQQKNVIFAVSHTY